MDITIKDLLLNVLFIILPIFFYQIFWDNNPPKHDQKRLLFWGAILVSSCILCMTFPIETIAGFRLDLRQIPLIISFYYGGYRLGFFTLIVILTYRFMLGGNGFFPALVVYTIVAVVLALTLQKYQRFNAKNRISMAIGISFLNTLIICTVVFTYYKAQFTPVDNFSVLLQFLLVQLITIFLAAYFMETMRNNKYLREKIHQSEKIKVASELAASVSHEVRNPLTVTQGFLQLLRQPGLSEEKRQYYINLALEELIRAKDIITDYLALAKPEMNNMELLDVKTELQYAITVLSPYAAMQSVEIVSSFHKNAFINGERQKIRQCFINLFKNSIEAMPSGGTLNITLSCSRNHVLIEVKDTGIGMTSEQISRLGTPYYSSKEKGTGLGTMVSYSIIRAMQGSIHVESEPGKGTQFSITIPAINSPSLS